MSRYVRFPAVIGDKKVDMVGRVVDVIPAGEYASEREAVKATGVEISQDKDASRYDRVLVEVTSGMVKKYFLPRLAKTEGVRRNG